MATEVELATTPSVSLADDELHRILEFDKIVKLSEAITSGKHPRIKIPPHLVRSSPSTANQTKGQLGRGTNATGTASSAQAASSLENGRGASAVHLRDNLGVFAQNSQLSVGTAEAASFPGLGVGSRERAISPSKVSPAEIPSQRARVEALIREQASRVAKITVADPAHVDFIVGDVLQKARELERTFTPPPVPILTQDEITDLGGVSVRPMNAASSAAADSVDDQTFYSSNFSTPEFALTSRVPADTDNDELSMQDGSDYEPELDDVPSPVLPSQSQPQQQQPSQQLAPDQLAPLIAQISNQTPAEILSSLLGANFDPNTLTRPIPPPPPPPAFQGAAPVQPADVADFLSAWGGQLPGLTRGLQSGGSGQVAAGNPKPSSPFVRTHDLSPIAPQPAHISSLAVAAQLPLAVDEQQSTSQGTPAQVAMLRRGEASQSSPDSSPYFDGNGPDKKKGKKKAIGKRKADINSGSPRIKLEPRSPSPILAPPAQRPHKRQRQETRETAYRYDDQYSPPSRTVPYSAARPIKESRVPIVYERVEAGRYVQQPREAAATRRAGIQQYDEQRDYDDVYEPAPARRYSARPPSAHHIVHQRVRSEYAPREFESSGHMSARPMTMAPPPTRVQHIPPPTTGRIVIDEFNREYFEPAPNQPTVLETVAYDPNVAYERAASRPQHAPGPGPRYDGYGSSQRIPAVYDDEEIVYQRTSPTYVAPRRVVTQPEYVTRETAGYPRREFSARPASQYPAAASARTYVLEEAAPAPGYLPRASTARPSEAGRYEVPPSGRPAVGFPVPPLMAFVVPMMAGSKLFPKEMSISKVATVNAK
ncbi:hypothetical protein SEUCBS139899_002653 [Sporothrix eucalyptigena]